MYKLKGFMSIPALVDNTTDTISPVGELSTYSRTYAKDIGEFYNAIYPTVKLNSFFSVDDQGAADVPTAQSDKALEIASWLYAQAIAGAFTSDSAACLTALTTQFTGEISAVSVGTMTLFNTDKYIPEWIAYTLEPSAGADNQIKIWLSDSSFRSQYDEYEIVVVPMADDIDLRLISNGGTVTFVDVKAWYDSLTNTDKMNYIQSAIGNYPPTLTKVVEYDWVDQVDSNLTFPTPWGILIYGVAGDNIDLIKSQVIAAILALSAYDQATWELFIPDIFKSTEFIITPLWTDYAIPNETLVDGIFSPTMDVSSLLTIAQTTAVSYDPAHVNTVLNSSVSNYRSTGFLAVGNVDNRDGIMTLKGKFSDYFVVPTTSIDFGRMSTRTQNWVVLLASMLQVADDMTEYSDIPFGMSRLKRGSVLYLVANYEDVQYLVVSRQSYEALFPPA